MAFHSQVVTKQPSATFANRTFLTRLPAESQQRIISQSSLVTLEKEERLLEAGAVLTWSYLPCTGLVSLQTMTEEGETVEVAMIGNEGVVGLPVGATSLANPHTAIVILPGEALRVRADILDKEFGRDPALQRAFIQYWHELTILIAQGSVCHRFHTARQRLASWLLAASSRTQSSRIHMTQERLGEALGLQRTGVTAASIALQDAGAIKARHGRITIVDRRKVEAIACECHRAAASPRL
jgi:CRP-like cAMP-binding protein